MRRILAQTRKELTQIVRDWRTRGRPHPVYVIGGTLLLALKLLNLPISMSQTWQSFASGMLAMAQ